MKTYNITGTQIRLMLAVASPLTIGRALGRVWDCQTGSEKQSRSTEQTNGIGFSAFDAREGSYIAKWCRDQNKAPTGKYLVRSRKLVDKYREQLASIYGSNPDMFEADFGQHIAIAMRQSLREVAEASLQGRRTDLQGRQTDLAPSQVDAGREPVATVTATVTYIDADGVIQEKVYVYKGVDGAANMLRAFDKFAGRMTKNFAAGKVYSQEASFANVG